MNLLTIAVFVLIIVLIYVIYKLMSKTTMNVSGFSDAANPVILPCKKFGTSTNSNYGYSTWLYIDTWATDGSTAVTKNVLTRYNTSNILFKLYLDNDQNDLNLEINGTSGTTTAPGTTTTTGTTMFNPKCTIRNVQLQKWINITISVYGNTVDMYLDGKLVRTCIMINLPIPLDVGDNVCIGGGYTVSGGKLTLPIAGTLQGYISNVVYKANYFTPEEAWNIYSAGYGGAGMFDFLTKYKLNFSITNDNQTLGAFSV
jgi:hypothetical protein